MGLFGKKGFGGIFKGAGLGALFGSPSSGAIFGGLFGGGKDKKKPGPYKGPTIAASTESSAYTQALEQERRKRAVLAAQDPNYSGQGRTMFGASSAGGKTMLGQ